MRLDYNFRKSFFRHTCSIEARTFSRHPSIGFRIDGPDRQIVLHVSLLAYVYLRLPWPVFLTPMSKSTYDGVTRLPEEREVKLSFHGWALWWDCWRKWGEWNSDAPWWMHGCIHFDNIIFGRHKCQFNVIETQRHTIHFIEGPYEVEVVKKERVDTWPRWFTKRSIAYEVKSDEGIPHKGKGESSWDCGESATTSSHFPAREIKNCYEAALYFEMEMKKTRYKYGGKNWIPRKYRNPDQP